MTRSDFDTVIEPNNVNVISVKLYSSQHNEPYDLSKTGGVWTHISIYENIARNYIEGEITIVDAQDNFARIPLVLGEKIEIEFQTPSASSSYVFVGNIHEVPSRKQVDQGSQIYVLKFISNEFVINQRLKFSKSYNEMLISDMVSKIHAQYIASGTTKQFNIAPTLNPTSCVVPTFSPFKAINWLGQWAVSPKYRSGASYLFFENQHGYYFGPIEALIDPDIISTPAASYRRSHTLTNKTDIQEAFNTIIDFVPKHNGFLNDMFAGLYASKIKTRDIVLRDSSEISYDYFQNYTKHKHLGHATSGTITNDSSLGAYSDSMIQHTPSHYSAYPDQNSTRSNETVLSRKSQFAQYFSLEAEITIPGDSERTVGEVIGIKLPNAAPTMESSSDEYDKYLSGRYLITALRHILTNNQGHHSHTIKMIGSKESYETPLSERLVNPWS
jgi:hypothetical protein